VTIGGIVNNSSGVISGGNAGIYLDYSSTVTGGITNSGLIQGDVNGIYSNDSTINGDIVNTPTGVIRGGTDIFQGGIYLDRTSVLSGRILNQGLIEGGEGGVVADDYSHIEQGVTNTGMISGAIAGINVLSFSTISGGIVNQGTIAGGSDGIRIVSYSAVTGGITNSGTISGGNYSIYVDDETASLDSISITGNDTAKFIGEVYAPNTPVTVVAGHSYTMDDGNLFTVQSFTNAGTLKIGAGNTGTITGDFINTGTFRPTVANTAYGKLVVNGNATLGGSLFVDASTLTAGHSYTNGTVSGVITASTTVSGTFASYDDNSLLFNLTPSYGSNQLDLVISAAGTTGVYDAVVAQGNRPATGAARVLDDIIAGDGQIAGLFLSVSASQAKISDAASQTLPLLTGGAQQAAHAAINSINRVVQARIESNLGLSSGNDFLGNKRVWLKPFGSWVEQDNRNGVAGYDARIMGFALGADAVASPATRVGLAFAYARADVNGKSSVAPTSADVDAYRLIGYGSYGLDENTEVNLQAGFGMNQNDGRRNLTAFVPTSVARSDYDSLTATVGVGLGRIYKFSEQTRFIPSIRADYTWVKDKGYTETGPSLLNLSVRSATSEEMIVAVDGKLMHEISQGTTLAANLGLGYDFLSDQASITSAFAGYPGATFVTNGIDPSPWVVRGGLGFTRMVRNDMEVTARYDAEHRKDFLNQTASVKLRWSF